MPSKAAFILRLLAFYGALLLLWQLIYQSSIWPQYVLPGPAQVFDSVVRYMQNGVLFESIIATLKRMLIGFGLAFGIGMCVGIANATVRWLD
jgi:NitT/TauT family transport system permease protein